MTILISSTQNNRIRAAIRLQDKKARVLTQKFGVEGAREISQAYKYGYELQELYFCERKFSNESGSFFKGLNQSYADRCIEVSTTVFEKLAMREDVDGLYAIFKIRKYTFKDLRKNSFDIFVVLENIEKPGNVGAILRTCDGVGVSGVFLTEGSVDVFNPNLIRASLGAVFSLPVISTSNQECYNFLKESNVDIVSTSLQTKDIYYEKNYRYPVALVLGNEAKGISEFWRKNANSLITIPMNGTVDSLNVSVAGAIMLYEVYRQRFRK
ncbi:MAG: RNA methyltransferase [Oligoflexales bacterium]|nr:RNA methyltransferase [Oligoflexales bacterium]